MYICLLSTVCFPRLQPTHTPNRFFLRAFLSDVSWRPSPTFRTTPRTNKIGNHLINIQTRGEQQLHTNTKQVVALFNAISKRQNQADGANASAGNSVGGAAKAAAVKGASRHAFLDMLKTGVKPTVGGASAAAGSGAATESGRKGGGASRSAEAGVGKVRCCCSAVPGWGSSVRVCLCVCVCVCS